MLFNTKYDLIFSIGGACSCSQVLRKCRLQYYSYPYDWLFGADMPTRVKILANNFQDFINFEDLKDAGYDNKDKKNLCEVYKNTRNGICFNHDFKYNKPLSQTYDAVKEKYKRRINRLISQIEKSKNVLVIYIQTPNNREEVDSAQLLECQKILKERFSKQNINLLYLYCNYDYKTPKREDISSEIVKISYDYDAHNKDAPFMVDIKSIQDIFCAFKITHKFMNIKNFIRRNIFLLKKFFNNKTQNYTQNTNQYDLICSLGGNCAAAHQLIERKLRQYSLPFDWCFIINEKPIQYLCEGFKNHFSNFALKKNLQELQKDEQRSAHSNNAQYKDTYSGYYFVNHFPKNVPLNKAYPSFYKKLKKRIKRLEDKIKSSKNILFLVSICYEFDYSVLSELKETLETLYPGKKFDFILVSFNCRKNEEFKINENIYVKRLIRDRNTYDFYKTNYEWSFLDNITINQSNKNKLLAISKIKKGLKINILPFISTIFAVKLYLFGIRLDFTIGKAREL